MNATLKLIERINFGLAGMILNASSGACVTIVNGPANKVEVACAPAEQRVIAQQPESAAATAAIVENGGFEKGLEGWGTGFYERLFRQGVGPLLFGGAVASWRPDQFAYKGRSALKLCVKCVFVVEPADEDRAVASV